jgi:hypothetical protein
MTTYDRNSAFQQSWARTGAGEQTACLRGKTYIVHKVVNTRQWRVVYPDGCAYYADSANMAKHGACAHAETEFKGVTA